MRSLILAAVCLIPLVAYTQNQLEDPTPDDPMTESTASVAVASVEAEVNLWHGGGDPNGGEAGDWKQALLDHRTWWLDIALAVDENHPRYDEIMWCLIWADVDLDYVDKWLFTLINCAEVRNEQARGYVDSAVGALDAQDWQGAYDYAEDAGEKLGLRSVQIGRAERDFDTATDWIQQAEDLFLYGGEN